MFSNDAVRCVARPTLAQENCSKVVANLRNIKRSRPDEHTSAYCPKNSPRSSKRCRKPLKPRTVGYPSQSGKDRHGSFCPSVGQFECGGPNPNLPERFFALYVRPLVHESEREHWRLQKSIVPRPTSGHFGLFTVVLSFNPTYADSRPIVVASILFITPSPQRPYSSGSFSFQMIAP